jgi:hypothetical protein
VTAFAALLLCFASPIPSTQIQGSVHDAQSGEALARVSVKIADSNFRAETDASGHFTIGGLEPGSHRLVMSIVGYRLFEKRIELKAADESVHVEAALSPDAFEHKDTVEVHAGTFDVAPAVSPTAFTLSGTEAKNLASVLADDPMRALQSVPGVAGDDDFDSRFTLHGAPYNQLGLYLDGILLHEPFHTVQGEGPSGSTAVFNGDMVASMTVESEGYAAQFEDRTAGVIDIETRAGSSDRIHFRVNASVPDAGALAEGPLGKKHKGSWLVSERKSYLQYFLKNLAQDLPSMAFGFEDTQAQLNYALTSSSSFSLKLIDGTSDLNRSGIAESSLGLNAALIARYHYTLVNFGWQFTPNRSFVLNTRAAFTRERYDNTNLLGEALGNGYYGEWVAKSDATWSWTDTAQLQLGGEIRPAHGAGFANYYNDQTSFVVTNYSRGGAAYDGGYAQQSFAQLAKGLSVSLGGRWDKLTANGQSALSPQSSLAYTPWANGKFSFAWGRYAEFPDTSSLYAENGSPRLLPAHADHYVAAFEERLGEHTRLRVEAFERSDRNLLFQPFEDARLLNGQVVPDNFQSPIMNTLTGATKGSEVFIQRRTANGWTGWASYTFSRSEMYDTLTRIHFPSDQDQRHTINGYLSYRLRPSVNLSSKFSWGSGFPVPGFFSVQDRNYYLATERNLVRLPAYQRLDIRMNKSKTFGRGKMTLYVEGVNVLNHANYRFDSYNGYDGSTGLAYISLSKMFPILPSAGVTFEF